MHPLKTTDPGREHSHLGVSFTESILSTWKQIEQLSVRSLYQIDFYVYIHTQNQA
jgi:hypothetical protein